MKLFFAAAAAAVCCSVCLVSCGSYSNMSDEDAYNVGYGIGTLLRNSVNN